MSSLHQLEERIGYHFRDIRLLKQAMTHSSYANEQHYPPHSDNERLEFLGDAVLELISSDHLYKTEPDRPEGGLTRRRAALVCEPTLAGVAAELTLGRYIRLGRGEASTGGAKRASILSDAFEALIGAMYLDGGIEAARSFLRSTLLTDIDHKIMFSDSKTSLQEIVQARYHQKLQYQLMGESGPDHAKTFVVSVSLGEKVLGTGEGSSKKAAEQQAAREAILTLNHVS